MCELATCVEVWGTAVQAVKAFQRQEMQLSLSQEQVARTEFHGVRLQSVGWHESLAAYFQLCKAWLTRIQSPSTT